MMATNVPKAKTSISVGVNSAGTFKRLKTNNQTNKSLILKSDFKNPTKRNIGKEVCFMENTSLNVLGNIQAYFITVILCDLQRYRKQSKFF